MQRRKQEGPGKSGAFQYDLTFGDDYRVGCSLLLWGWRHPDSGFLVTDQQRQYFRWQAFISPQSEVHRTGEVAEMTNDSAMQLTAPRPLLPTLLIIPMSHLEELVPLKWKERLEEVFIT